MPQFTEFFSHKFFVWGWIIWGTMFAVLEGLAIANGLKGDTLSEQIWKFTDNGPAAAGLVVAFLLWMAIHFAFGGRYG